MGVQLGYTWGIAWALGSVMGAGLHSLLRYALICHLQGWTQAGGNGGICNGCCVNKQLSGLQQQPKHMPRHQLRHNRQERVNLG